VRGFEGNREDARAAGQRALALLCQACMRSGCSTVAVHKNGRCTEPDNKANFALVEHMQAISGFGRGTTSWVGAWRAGDYTATTLDCRHDVDNSPLRMLMVLLVVTYITKPLCFWKHLAPAEAREKGPGGSAICNTFDRYVYRPCRLCTLCCFNRDRS
jgi:hypothetical protein